MPATKYQWASTTWEEENMFRCPTGGGSLENFEILTSKRGKKEFQ